MKKKFKVEVYVSNKGEVVKIADFYSRGDAFAFCVYMNKKEKDAGSEATYFIENPKIDDLLK